MSMCIKFNKNNTMLYIQRIYKVLLVHYSQLNIEAKSQWLIHNTRDRMCVWC